MKTGMRRVYIADNNTIFLSAHECLTYEARRRVGKQLESMKLFSLSDREVILSWLDNPEARDVISHYYRVISQRDGNSEPEEIEIMEDEP